MFRLNASVSDKRSSIQETPPSTRILVIGAGYAGLLCTMRLAGKVARRHVQIALVNDSATFTERPRLPQFATNQLIPWRSLPQMLHKTQVQFLQGRVTSLDPAHPQIVVVDQQHTQHVEYDYLVYALGSMTDRQSMPGVAEYAYTLAPSGPLSAAALCACTTSTKSERKEKFDATPSSIMMERSGKVEQHTLGFATAIHTWWDVEIEPGVTKEDEHGGII